MHTNQSLPYLEKVARGGLNTLPDLVATLSSQDLYVPVLDRTTNSDSNLVLSAPVRQEAGSSFVPAFTSRERLQLWVRLRGIEARAERINGAILAGGLAIGLELKIDPDSSHSVMLTPKWVRRLSQTVPFPEADPYEVSALRSKVERERTSMDLTAAPHPSALPKSRWSILGLFR